MCGRRWADEWVCLCVSEGGGVYVCMRVFFSDVKYIQTFFFFMYSSVRAFEFM